jgi:predicted nucleic acid-binding protein
LRIAVPVVDATVVVDLVAPGIAVDVPARLLMKELAAEHADIAAPALMWLETANALLTGIRRGRWDGAGADAALAELASISVRSADTPTDRWRAFDLARRYDNWPVYDMLYVALAERLGTEFYTADEKLRARLAHLPWVRGLAGKGAGAPGAGSGDQRPA